MARRGAVAAGCALAALLTGCGPSARDRHIPSSATPLVPGARIVASAESCDPGKRAYCARDLVVIGPRYKDNFALRRAQRELYIHSHWTPGPGEVSVEQSATSPNGRIRATFARTNRELEAVAARQIRRPPAIVAALAQVTFSGVPGIAIVLEAGPSSH
jgi:hypothetical protein